MLQLTVALKINKRSILKKLIIFPKKGARIFFSKEMKLLNDLITRYSIEFVAALTFEKKFDSVAIFLCDSFKAELDRKFLNFNYKIDESKYDKFIIEDKKFGEDLKNKKKIKTIREFLNG